MPHHALGARVDVDGGDGRVLVGQQRHLRLVRGRLRDLADEPVRGHDGVVVLDSVRASGGDDDALLELARQLGDDLRRHGLVVLRELRPGEIVQRLRQRLVLLGRELELDQPLAHPVELGLELVALGLRVHEPAHVVVEVLEGMRDARGGDLERAQDGRPGVLDRVQRSAARLAEVDGDEDERDDDEHAEDDPSLDRAAEAAAQAGRIRGRRRPLR